MRIRPYTEVLRDRVVALGDLRRRVAAGEDVHLFIPTGLRQWDRNGGIEKGVLTVIAGSTGEGKSIVKLHLATEAAKAGFRVLILDFEDPSAKTADRSLAGATGLNSREIAMLRFTDADMDRLVDALEDSAPWAPLITHVEGLADARTVRELLAAHPEAELVLFDYAQGLPEEDGENYERTLANLAWDLNKDAQDRNRAVVVFSQVLDSVEQAGDDRARWSIRRGAERVDLGGYRPGPGRKDLARCRAMGERAKQLWYFWRPGRWAKKWGVQGAKDNRIEFVADKVNFAGEGRFEVGVDLATARLMDIDQ